MERRRKLGWIKIVKKSREFLWQSWKKTRGPLVIASKLESETEVVDVTYNFVTVYTGIYRAI